jgi:hypothetical protein
MDRTPKSNNTWPILTLVGAEILCLMAYVAACELRSKEPALCESRWAMALPAIALAGQSAATYFMDPNRQPPPPSGDSAVSGRAMGPLGQGQARSGRHRQALNRAGRLWKALTKPPPLPAGGQLTATPPPAAGPAP